MRRHISDWGDRSEASERRAELMAAAVVAAHNRVLSRWLRSECTDPQVEIDEALATVHDYFAPPTAAPRAVLVVRTDSGLATIADALEQM